MAISSPSSSSCLDTLFYCEEHDLPWVTGHDYDEDNDDVITETTHQDSSLNDQDFFWEDEELVSLFTKEQQQLQLHTSHCTLCFDQTDPSRSLARKEAVDWILKVKSHFGFTHLTAILSINYLDRFISSFHFQNDKPWMVQLLAVTCLSLAAKVEQTEVPSLVDLQVEDTPYLFEPKTIQKMELLVMSTLKWRMNPVTPISFLDHIVRRLGLTNHLHWDFFKKCEALLLDLVSDSRFSCFEPSVLATATMLRVVDETDPPNSIDYKSQLLDLLKPTKEKINECYELVMDRSFSNKRKTEEHETRTYPLSPDGVIDFTCDESSNDSWEVNDHRHFHQPSLKKTRIDQHIGFGSLISFEPGFHGG